MTDDSPATLSLLQYSMLNEEADLSGDVGCVDELESNPGFIGDDELFAILDTTSDDDDTVVVDYGDVDTPVLVSKVTFLHGQGVNDFAIWPSPNFELISKLCDQLTLSDQSVGVLLAALSKFVPSLPYPRSTHELRRVEREVIPSSKEIVIPCPIPVPLLPSGMPMTNADMSLRMLDVWSLIQDLLNDEEHAEHVVLCYSPVDAGVEQRVNDSAIGGRELSELWTGEWFRRQQALLPSSHSKLLVPIFATDETTVCQSGTHKVHPVYVTLGNLHQTYRQRSSGRRLLGFIPIIKPLQATRSNNAVVLYRRKVKRWVMEQLVAPIVDKRDGICLRVGGEWQHMYPRMPFVVGDEPEQSHSVVGLYLGQSAIHPCNVCLVNRKDGLHALGPYRSLNDRFANLNFDPSMVDAASDPVGASFHTRYGTLNSAWAHMNSLHPDPNAMFSVPGLNPFLSPPCLMHQTDGGIFKSLVLGATIQYIKTYLPSKTIDVFDERWAFMGRFAPAKRFNNGVSALTNVTCSELRMMAQSLPFIVRGLESDERVFEVTRTFVRDGKEMIETENFVLPARFLETLAVSYLEWRSFIRSHKWTSDSLDALYACGTELQTNINLLRCALKGKRVDQGIKFHKIQHWAMFIEEYGSPANYNASFYETAHKDVKRWRFALSFKRDHSERKLLWKDQVFDFHKSSSHSHFGCAQNPFSVVRNEALKLADDRRTALLVRGLFVLDQSPALEGYSSRRSGHCSAFASEQFDASSRLTVLFSKATPVAALFGMSLVEPDSESHGDCDPRRTVSESDVKRLNKRLKNSSDLVSEIYSVVDDSLFLPENYRWIRYVAARGTPEPAAVTQDMSTLMRIGDPATIACAILMACWAHAPSLLASVAIGQVSLFNSVFVPQLDMYLSCNRGGFDSVRIQSTARLGDYRLRVPKPEGMGMTDSLPPVEDCGLLLQTPVNTTSGSNHSDGSVEYKAALMYIVLLTDPSLYPRRGAKISQTSRARSGEIVLIFRVLSLKGDHHRAQRDTLKKHFHYFELGSCSSLKSYLCCTVAGKRAEVDSVILDRLWMQPDMTTWDYTSSPEAVNYFEMEYVLE